MREHPDLFPSAHGSETFVRDVLATGNGRMIDYRVLPHCAQG